MEKSKIKLPHDLWEFYLFGMTMLQGNPLQCSCLENPRDGGAWWAAIYGVAQSQTRLKRLGSAGKESAHSGVVEYLLQYSGLENSIVYGLYSPWGCKQSDITEQLSLSPCYKQCISPNLHRTSS